MSESPYLPISWLQRDRFPLVLLLLAVMFATCLMPAQSDTWWQLRTGQEMWRTGRIMLHDEFTHTVAGQRWPNHEWLSQIVFYGVHSLGGMPLLTFMCALAVTTAWAIVASLTPGAPLVRVALVGGGVVLSAGGWTLRPQVLTMTLFAATLWILVRRRGVWMLPVIFLLWANLHGAVALGGVLVIAASLAALKARDPFLRTLIPVGALCLIATALTPLGTSLWLEIPTSLRRLQTYGVDEWRSPGFTHPADIAFWLVGAAAMVVTAMRRRVLESTSILTLTISMALLFIMATRSGRHVTPFVLCATPALATLLHAGAGRRERSHPHGRVVPNAVLLTVALAGAVLFVANAWREPLPRLRWRPISHDLMAAIATCEGRLYNRYDEGGYLIWFMPNRKVYMDSRQDPFPEALVLEQITIEQSGEYATAFERHDIGCALTLQGSQLAAHLKQDGWTERRADHAWSIYSRPAQP